MRLRHGVMLGALVLAVALPIGCKSSRRVPLVQAPATPPAVQVQLAGTVNTDQDLTATILVTALDDAPVRTTLRWLNHGQPMPLDGPVVPAAETRINDVWSIEVTASVDGAEAYARAETRVVNRPPTLGASRILPSPLLQGRPATLVLGPVSDADGHEVLQSYAWRINGEDGPRNRPLDPSEVRLGDELAATVTLIDPFDTVTVDVGPVTVLPPPRPLHVVFVMDVTGSFASEIERAALGAADFLGALEASASPGDHVGMTTFTYRYASMRTPLFALANESALAEAKTDWPTLRHASRIPGSSPDPANDGPRPHMPREYDGEQGTDHHVGMVQARQMLAELDASDAPYRAIVLLTDGQPVNIRESTVRSDIGYVEDRWEVYEGPVPHTPDEIRARAIEEAVLAHDTLDASVWIVSFRERNDFMRAMVQGDGEFHYTTNADDLPPLLLDIATAMRRVLVE